MHHGCFASGTSMFPSKRIVAYCNVKDTRGSSWLANLVAGFLQQQSPVVAKDFCWPAAIDPKVWPSSLCHCHGFSKFHKIARNATRLKCRTCGDLLNSHSTPDDDLQRCSRFFADWLRSITNGHGPSSPHGASLNAQPCRCRFSHAARCRKTKAMGYIGLAV